MKTKNLFLTILCVCTLFLCFGSYSFAKSNKPPFSTVTIYGKTDTKFNRVSLFKSGGAAKPYKTTQIGSSGKYSITIRIPKDMIEKGGYYMSDMRFWKDDNNNRIKDKGEPRSQCHFVMWHPEHKKVVMQVYQGNTYEINKTKHKYNLQ